MSTDIPLLSNVQVAAPCSASWKHMEIVDGDKVHFCAGCKKNVYNLSAMTQAQAEGLLRKHEGHLCVRYYKRTDGTTLTRNCPVGQAALRMKMIARSKRAAFATAAFVSMVAFADSNFNPYHRTMGRVSLNAVQPLMPGVRDAFADAGVPVMVSGPEHEKMGGNAKAGTPALKESQPNEHSGVSEQELVPLMGMRVIEPIPQIRPIAMRPVVVSNPQADETSDSRTAPPSEITEYGDIVDTPADSIPPQ